MRRPVWCLMACLALVDCSNCNGNVPRLVDQLEDRDHDGWFSAASNTALTLTLTSASFPAIGGYQVLVDEVRFPISSALSGTFSVPIGSAGTPMPIGVAVATRVRGVDGLGATGTPFGANVRVVYRTPPTGEPGVIVGDTRVVFGETSTTLSPTMVSFALGTVTLNFTVSSAPFADPNPNDPNGDSDMDGIPESGEARLSGYFNGIFDPRAGSLRDVDLIIGQIAPNYALSQWAREDLRSRFFLNGIELHLDEGTLNNTNGHGGVMNLGATGAVAGGNVTPAQALAVRNLNVPAERRANTYFVLLADFASVDGTTAGRAFGWTIPGAIVMRTGFLGINDISWYQAGVLMHELGHEFDLCHPASHDGATVGGTSGGVCGRVCPAIPVPQRDGGASVMGAPSDDPNFAVAAINVLRRPLDYAPAQWPLVRLGCSFVP